MHNKIFLKKNLSGLIPSLIILIFPIIFSFYPYTRINKKVIDETYKKYMSEDVQKNGYAVTTKSFSRKDSSKLKLELLSKINISQKDIIILSNHQLQYITENLNEMPIFNMWMGNYGITEIADIVTYMDTEGHLLLPNKILVTQITSPNNDLGGSIVGYRDELPDFIAGKSKNPYVLNMSKLIFSPGVIFNSHKQIRKLRQSFDYKNLWGFIKSEILMTPPENDIYINKDKNVSGEFSFDKTGSSKGKNTIPLVFNESHKNTKNKSSLKLSDAKEIIFSLQKIDEIAHQRNIIHVLLIPPVYESNDQEKMDSFVNKVLDLSIKNFSKKAKSTIIIDHRRNPRFLGYESAKYYEDFDHPSPLYGEELFEDIKKVTKINF